MSAIEDTACAAGVVGKDTRGGSQPPLGGVHPATDPTLVHLPYGDAVWAELVTVGLVPDVVEAGLRMEEPQGPRELFLTLSWLSGHPDLADPTGMDLVWSHLTGWAVRTGHDVQTLTLISTFAAPALLADAVLHTATEGLGRAWEPADPLAEWEHTRSLDLALNEAAGRGVIAW